MRLFVAAEVPGEVAARLAAWTPRDPALRAVAVEALHLTLAFLGERSAAEAEAAGRALEGAARPVAALALGPARWLPPRRPRALAVEVIDGSGALKRLRGDVVGALTAAIGFEPERRAFLPHVTVARVRRGARVRPLRLAPPGGEPFAATALTLFRSRLSPQGARYEALVRLRL